MIMDDKIWKFNLIINRNKILKYLVGLKFIVSLLLDIEEKRIFNYGTKS